MPGRLVQNRGHGGLRGLGYVHRSSSADSRFGRMFRWLPGESFGRDALGRLALSIIQQESAKAAFPGSGVAEGPSAAFNPPPPQALDTPLGEAEPGDECERSGYVLGFSFAHAGISASGDDPVF